MSENYTESIKVMSHEVAHWIVRERNLLWKSLLTVSLMNRFFSVGMFRAWCLKSVSSCHFRLSEYSPPYPFDASSSWLFRSGFPWSISCFYRCFISSTLASSLSRCSSSLSFLSFSYSRISSSSSSLELSSSSSKSDPLSSLDWLCFLSLS